MYLKMSILILEIKVANIILVKLSIKKKPKEKNIEIFLRLSYFIINQSYFLIDREILKYSALITYLVNIPPKELYFLYHFCTMYKPDDPHQKYCSS